ncbi:MAG TPA: hypothetical protein VGP13_02935 [Candidatus Paceibacterota bacterium]|jgi:hypothetical protein|nr:hypothetical protein [Candidatus Paceibacterota bacterium]
MNDSSMDKFIHGIGRYWFLILIAGFVIYSVYDDNVTPQLPPPASAADTQQAVIPPPDMTPGVSLPTGTVLKQKSQYLQEHGSLKIDNGTDFDAVAKLIHGVGDSGTSVLSVYIQAHGTYTMEGISDGTYWLAFAQGTDWNTATQKFNRNNQVSSFADTFDYVTRDTDEYYPGWHVTLNPVVGGNAETKDVSAEQFDAY